MEKTLLRTDKLVWQVRGRNKKILDQVTVSFASGEFTVILGPNGAGKSSLLRHLLAFKKAQAGTVRLDGRDINSFSRKELAAAMAYLPQTSAANPALSAKEVIAMGRYRFLDSFSGLGPRDYAALDEAIARAGCEKLLNSSFRNLSGGEKQRILCARAIAQESRFILLDEPVAHLDLRYQHTILATLKKLSRERGCGIICVMHDVNLARQYADRALFMKEGRKIAEGPCEKVFQTELLSQVYDWPVRELPLPTGGSFFYAPSNP